MRSSESLLRLDWWVAGIEFIGALVIAGYAARALAALVFLPIASGRLSRLDAARLIVADGVILGLSLKLAGTLLKALALHSWDRIGMFAVVLALRIVLKRLFTWEKARLENPACAAVAIPTR